MDWKKLFKPTVSSIIITLALLVLTFLLIDGGWPLKIMITYVGPGPSEFNYLSAIVDLIFWYFVSSIITYPIRVKKKKTQR